MALRCGLVGLPGSGKTTIYRAMTATQAASFGKNDANRATVPVPDARVARLVELYRPKKIVQATLEIVDIPGIAAGGAAEGGRGARLLGPLNEMDALLYVIRCHAQNGPATDPAEDIETVSLELMVADALVLQRKIDRLAKRVRAGDKDAMQEVTDCDTVLARLQQGIPARKQNLTDAQRRSVTDCNLLSLKPTLYVANVASSEDERRAVEILQPLASGEQTEIVWIRGRDEAEISELDPEDRTPFLAELGLQKSSMERLIHAAYRLLGVVTFFTAGEREVHAWTCRCGDTAPVAAGRIHSDIEGGFVRMEVIPCEDLLRHGGESAAARAGAQRLEGRNYLVQDGDVVAVRFTPSQSKRPVGARG